MSTVAIVTGGGRGMGRACAQHLTTMVDHLLLVDRDEHGAHAAAGQLSQGQRGALVEPVVLDITDTEGLGRLAARVSELGTLRAVAHAAGISPTMADWRRIFEVDLVGTARLAAALRPLAAPGMAMVFFSSMSALLKPPQPNDAELDTLMADPLDEYFLDRIEEAGGAAITDPANAYPVAKRGVKQLVQREAVRLGTHGARVCSISPGIIDTPQGQQEAAAHPSIAAMVARTPLGRMGHAEELAAVAAFILSDQASFLTGIDILVDGGVVAALHTGPRR